MRNFDNSLNCFIKENSERGWPSFLPVINRIDLVRLKRNNNSPEQQCSSFFLVRSCEKGEASFRAGIVIKSAYAEFHSLSTQQLSIYRKINISFHTIQKLKQQLSEEKRPIVIMF